MAIKFDCPNCKTSYEVADDLAGKMIMCRGCRKRGAVPGTAKGTAAPAAAGTSSTQTTSRRGFLIVGGLASVVAIAGGAVLARQPWRRWQPPPSDRFPDRPRRRPPDDQKQKGKDKGPTA